MLVLAVPSQSLKGLQLELQIYGSTAIGWARCGSVAAELRCLNLLVFLTSFHARAVIRCGILDGTD
jgi:hypothetical protein